MEVEELIARAWGAVKDAGVPEALQEVAFNKAIDFLTQDSVPDTPTTPAPHTPRAPGTTAKPAEEDPQAVVKPVDTKSLFDKFAREASISVDDLREVYYFDESGPHLTGPRSKFGSTTAEQAKTIALAITTARNYALDETETADDVLKKECLRLKCDPKKNWSTIMGSLSTVVYSGPRGKRSRALNRLPIRVCKIW